MLVAAGNGGGTNRLRKRLGRDVTSQHDSEIRFTELFQSLREGIFFSTPDGKILDANPALINMLGYTIKEELQARSLRDLYQDPTVRDALMQELDREGAVQNREIVFLRKDNKPLYCLASGFAIRDAAGRMVQTQGTIVDITERREIEKKLHKEQEFVRGLIDSFPDMVAVFDRDKKFTYVSPRVQDVLGVEPKDFIGQHIGWRSDPENAGELRNYAGQRDFRREEPRPASNFTPGTPTATRGLCV